MDRSSTKLRLQAQYIKYTEQPPSAKLYLMGRQMIWVRSVHFSSFYFIYRFIVNIVNASWQVQGDSNNRMASDWHFDNIWGNDDPSEWIHAPHRHGAMVRTISCICRLWVSPKSNLVQPAIVPSLHLATDERLDGRPRITNQGCDASSICLTSLMGKHIS